MSTSITRREFLQFAGLSLAALHFPWVASASHQPLRVRALATVPLRARPNFHAPVIAVLWPDSIHYIQSHANDDWIQIGDGFSPTALMQPMLPPDPDATITSQGFPTWVEVIAPFAAIRQYCAASAPLLARIGHGGVLWAERALVDDTGSIWLQTASGWLQAHHIQRPPEYMNRREVLQRPHHPNTQTLSSQMISHPPTLPRRASHSKQLIIIHQHHIDAYENERHIMRLKCRVPKTLPRQITITDMQPGQTVTDANGTRHGAPWHLIINGGALTIGGVYWHHDFNHAAKRHDYIELSALAARALYSWVQPEQVEFEVAM